MKQNRYNSTFGTVLKKGILAFVLSLTLLTPNLALAAATDLPCVPSKSPANAPTDGTVAVNNDLFDCINKLYKYALIVASIAGVFMIMLGGYMYIFSGGNEKKVGTAKSFITSSLLGIAVLLTGFLLLRQINPSLTTVKSITPSQIAQQNWVQLGNGGLSAGSTDPGRPGTGPAGNGQAGNVQGNGVTCNGGIDKRTGNHVDCSCFSAEVKTAASEFGVPAALIRAVLYQETNCGKNNNTSIKGAQGAMQILEGTAQGAKCAANWNTDNLANIRCGAKILKTLNIQYGNLGTKYVLAAYNGGGKALQASTYCPGVQRFECAFDNADHSKCNAGVSTYEQTRDYVVSGTRFYNEAVACGN